MQNRVHPPFRFFPQDTWPPQGLRVLSTEVFSCQSLKVSLSCRGWGLIILASLRVALTECPSSRDPEVRPRLLLGLHCGESPSVQSFSSGMLIPRVPQGIYITNVPCVCFVCVCVCSDKFLGGSITESALEGISVCHTSLVGVPKHCVEQGPHHHMSPEGI